MNKWLEILLGLILVIVPIVVVFQWLNQGAGTWNFLSPAWAVLKGGVFWAIVGIGALFILLGISDLKE